MLRRLALALAISLCASCLAVERWPKIEPPYTPESIEGGRTLYVRPQAKTPVTMKNAVWEVEDGRAWLAGEVHDEPDSILDVPRRFLVEIVFEREAPWWRPERIAVDEITVLRVAPLQQGGKNLTGYAVLVCLALVVLVLVAA